MKITVLMTRMNGCTSAVKTKKRTVLMAIMNDCIQVSFKTNRKTTLLFLP
jgi:hypothetical protein